MTGLTQVASWRNGALEEITMKIYVCVKQVPDTETKIQLKADKSGIEEAGIKWVMNPYDEFAVEEAGLERCRTKINRQNHLGESISNAVSISTRPACGSNIELAASYPPAAAASGVTM